MTDLEIKELGTSAICDAMVALKMGVRSLDNKIIPINERINFCCGPAFTIQGATNGSLEEKHKGMEVMNKIFTNCIVIIHANGGNNVGNWGELMSTAAIARGAKGVVL